MSQPLDYAAPQTSQPGRFRREWAGWIIFGGLAVFLFIWLKQQNSGVTSIPLSTFYAQMRADNISRVTIDGDELDGTFRAPVAMGASRVANFRTYLPTGAGGSWAFAQWLMDTSRKTVVRAEPANNFLINSILPLVPWVLIFCFIWFFVFRRLRNQRLGQPMPVVIVNPPAQ